MSNKVDQQYKDTIKKILKDGIPKKDRTGVGTISLFGHQMRFNMSDGFPLLTLRKIHTKSVIHELLWFLGSYDQDKYGSFGNTNIRYLLDNGVTFWSDWPYKEYMKSRKYRPELPVFTMQEFESKIILDDNFAKEFGSIGPGYGKQWTNYGGYTEKKRNGNQWDLTIHEGVNQIDYIINELKKNPDSRRLILDAWKVDEINDMLLPPCFLSGIKVFTYSGYKNIEDIVLDDIVLTHLGNFKKVNKIFKTSYKGKILKIKPRYVSHSLDCTPNHPFLVKDRGWVEAKNITTEDKICIKINNFSILPKLKIKLGVNQYEESKINNVILDNLDDWYVMGYFLGNGWINYLNSKKEQVFFAISDEQENKILNRLSKRMSLYKDKRYNGKAYRFECRNKKWYEILKEFDKFSQGKIIPNWVQDAPIEYIDVFLEGYFDAVGYIVKRNKSKIFSTTSNDISFGIQRLFAKIGKISCHTFQNRKKITNIIGGEVNRGFAYNILLNNNPHKSKFDFDENYLYVGISKIEEILIDDYVYNLEVKDDNSYTVNNICTHNCHMLFQLYSSKMSDEERLYLYSKQSADNKLSLKPMLDQYNFSDRKLSMQMYQRSCDFALGCPFNVAEYSLLLHMISKVVNMVPDELIINFGDIHIYNNHIEQMEKLLERSGYDLPTLILNQNIKIIYDFRYEDIIIENYKSYPNLKMEVAV